MEDNPLQSIVSSLINMEPLTLHDNVMHDAKALQKCFKTQGNPTVLFEGYLQRHTNSCTPSGIQASAWHLILSCSRICLQVIPIPLQKASSV
ncbi:unnamed protein product [Sphagnum tenellum]